MYCQQLALPSNQQPPSKPCQQLGNFLAGLASRFIFRCGFSCRERVAEGSALLESNGRYFQTVNLNGGACIGEELRGPWRNSVQDDKGRFLSELHQLGRASDGTKIEDSSTTGDQHQVGCSCCSHCSRFRMWGGVDDDQFSPAIGRSLQTLRQASMWKRNDNRSLTLSAITPTGGACLGIEVDNRGWKPGRFSGRGDVQGEGGFSSPTFLADNGDCFHIAGIAAKIIYGKMLCRHTVFLAIQQKLGTTPAALLILSNSRLTPSAEGVVFVVWVSFVGPPMCGPANAAGHVSGLNSGDRLCFALLIKMR